MAELRWYQKEAVESVYDHLRKRKTNPCVVLPTGAGKSWVIAQICADAVKRWNGRVLVLAHRKELLEQNAAKIQALCPEQKVGVYSAGLGRRDTETPIVVAGVQSVWNRAAELGPFNLVIADECHLIPDEGDGIYRSFFDACREINPRVYFIGMTATPYRMESGTLCGPKEILNEICYEIGVRKLIARGFLCPLVSREGADVADLSGVHVRAGEFEKGELEELMGDERLVDSACREIVALTRDRRKCLLFSSGIEHGRRLCDKVRQLGERCEFVSGGTPPAERDRILSEFRDGALRYLANCDILTTGFDAPNIDCIALLRPTRSPGLYSQMVGRGLRVHPDKENCLVLDYGENIRRHGPIDRIRVRARHGGEKQDGAPPLKRCPGCGQLLEVAFAVCPQCGHKWEEMVARHSSEASCLAPLSPADGEWHDVRGIGYSVHKKRGSAPGHPLTLRVEYGYGEGRSVSDFVCVEHDEPRRAQAEVWWRQRSKVPCPEDAKSAWKLARGKNLREPTRLFLREVPGRRFPEILVYDVPDEYPDPGFRHTSWDEYVERHGKEPF